MSLIFVAGCSNEDDEASAHSTSVGGRYSGYGCKSDQVYSSLVSKCLHRGSCDRGFGQSEGNCVWEDNCCWVDEVYTRDGCLPRYGCNFGEGRTFNGSCIPSITVGEDTGLGCTAEGYYPPGGNYYPGYPY